MPPSVLILARDSLTARLVGALVELARGEAHFPGAREHPRRAIARVNASLLLLDCEHEAAADERTYSCARLAGSKVRLFSAGRTLDEARAATMHLGRHVLALPLSPSAFSEWLASAVSPEGPLSALGPRLSATAQPRAES